jgi:hypothetical protein
MSKLIDIQSDIQGINTTDLIMQLGYNLTNVNQTVLNAIYVLNLISSSDVWNYYQRNLTYYPDMNVTVNNSVNVTFNGTVLVNTSGIPQEVWNYTNRTLTSFNFNISLADNVENVLNALATFAELRYAGGTEYNYGEIGQVAYLFLDVTSGVPSPVNNGQCNVSVWYPNKTLVFSNVNMSFLANGIYYHNYTIPNVEGVYAASSICNNGSVVGFGSSSFHVAPWANQIYDITNISMNDTINITGDAYGRLQDFMVAYFAPAEATSRVCLNNNTLRIAQDYTSNITGSSNSTMVIQKYQDFTCTNGCDTLTKQCVQSNPFGFWILLASTVMSFYFMFGRKEPIFNIIGAIIIILESVFLFIYGVDLNITPQIAGTSGGDIFIKNLVTYTIAFVFVAIGLYKLFTGVTKSAMGVGEQK